MNRWKSAQAHERRHWEGLIAGIPAGKEQFWLDLWSAQAKFLQGVLKKHIKITKKTRILEIGGGAIGVIRWFKKGKLFALDPLGDLFEASFPNLPLEDYKLRRDVKCIVAPAEEANKLDIGPFDLVLMFDCLDHCQVPRLVLRSIRSILKPNGLLLESTTAFHEPTVPAVGSEYAKYHLWYWTAEELKNAIATCGFRLTFESDQWPCHPGFKEEGSNSDQVLHLWERAR